MLRINVSAINHHFFTLGIFAKKAKEPGKEGAEVWQSKSIKCEHKKIERYKAAFNRWWWWW
jgi:hypothetical protein